MCDLPAIKGLCTSIVGGALNENLLQVAEQEQVLVNGLKNWLKH